MGKWWDSPAHMMVHYSHTQTLTHSFSHSRAIDANKQKRKTTTFIRDVKGQNPRIQLQNWNPRQQQKKIEKKTFNSRPNPLSKRREAFHKHRYLRITVMLTGIQLNQQFYGYCTHTFTKNLRLFFSINKIITNTSECLYHSLSLLLYAHWSITDHQWSISFISIESNFNSD